MKFAKLLVASAALVAVMGAQAQVTGSLGGGFGPFLSLSNAGLNGGAVATLAGGTVQTQDLPIADIPFGMVFENKFLAAGPSSGPTATLTFAGAGLGYISFLWGSPDAYNVLTVNSTAGSQTFSASSLGFSSTDGDQDFSQYVQFSASAGTEITSLTFTNSSAIDAFETANYSVTAVPEPQTYALLLAGLGAIGFITRRRNNA